MVEAIFAELHARMNTPHDAWTFGVKNFIFSGGNQLGRLSPKDWNHISLYQLSVPINRSSVRSLCALKMEKWQGIQRLPEDDFIDFISQQNQISQNYYQKEVDDETE